MVVQEQVEEKAKGLSGAGGMFEFYSKCKGKLAEVSSKRMNMIWLMI